MFLLVLSQCEMSNDLKEIPNDLLLQKNNSYEPLQEINSNKNNLEITMKTNNLVELINSGILNQINMKINITDA